ncbi:LysR substrate-binding domain-containing protein [Variovorax sp. H27-G14]|uniref:LysR substrate-binding domain-containing protein n=1 Tax=Variovorax sp. H27-G14 TaxID=3111914 RepID=UPI0038FCD42B
MLDVGKAVQVRVTGQLTCSGAYQMLHAALNAHELACLPADMTQPHVVAGRLLRVMDDCCPSFPALHAYYPSHRNSSRAMQLVIEAIRYRR